MTCQCTHKIEDHTITSTGKTKCQKCECVYFSVKATAEELTELREMARHGEFVSLKAWRDIKRLLDEHEIEGRGLYPFDGDIYK